MIKAVTKYLREIAASGGRGGTKETKARKGFGSAEVRAKAAATRSANRKRDEQNAMQEAVYKATARRGK